ncbi:MAG TPA: zinc-binding dehydrogenase [Dehalococcoidia bacterium]|nr:zinc-binding dehydrogenase [Dehalococcoidia bacterium]
MPSIRAVVVDPNAPAHLTIASVDAPTPGAGDALIRVRALSLNRGEVRGAQNSRPGARPGWDIAGVVQGAAADGTGPKQGERVVGMLRTTAWAELVAVPATNLAVLPENVSFQDASTLPVAGLTALYALDRADGLLQRNVLVTGASGGVGHLGVQMAKHAGATVTGLVRQEKHAQSVKDAGAVNVVADETGEAARAHGPYNHILESVGGQVLANSISMLAPSGHCVVYGVSGGGPMTMDSAVFLRSRGHVSGLAVFTEIARETASVGLARLARMVGEGTLKPLIAVEAPWTEIGNVAQQLLDRSYPGKAVLTVD